MAVTTYKGTKITGTSTTAKVFTHSGVKYANVHDIYINTSEGHVYKCAKKGKASEATWKYDRTDICGKPSLDVYGLKTPVRTTSGSNTRLMHTEWKVPKELTNKKNGRRADSLVITWTLNYKNDDGKTFTRTATKTVGISVTESTINLNNFKVGKDKVDRNSFYPFHGLYLTSVSVAVTAKNSEGLSTKKEKAKASRKFLLPKKPTISAFEFDTENGQVSTTIKTDAGAGYKERYDTYYTVTVTDTRTGKTKVVNNDKTKPSTEFTATYDVTDYQQLTYGQYVKIVVEAYARGYAGPTKKRRENNTVSRTYYVGYPNKATIGEKISISGTSSMDKCTIPIDPNWEKEHPVDRVKLEYLANVEYATASSIPGDASWTSTDIVDDGQCTALSIPVGDLLPDPGKHTWIRVKSWHASETVLYRYSDYVELKELYIDAPTATDDKIDILSATPGSDGKSIVVELGWNKNNQDDSTGTELSWSDEPDTWKSTESPSEYTFTWSDGAKTVGNVTYQDSAVITIKNLEEGVKYYIKARRYLEGDTTTYSDYAEAFCITSETPLAVVVVCDKYVPHGKSLPVYWTHSGSGMQTEWQLVQSIWYGLSTDTVVETVHNYYTYNSQTESYTEVTELYQHTSDVDIVEGKSYFTRSGAGTAESPYVYTKVEEPSAGSLSTYYEYKNPSLEGWYCKFGGTVLAEGKGSMTSTQISADRIMEFADNGSLTFTVQISTGSGFISSDPHTVTVLDPPTLNVIATSPLAVQPLSFTATSSRTCDLTVIVTSQGSVGQFPEGLLRQTAGDTIYSAVFSPEWTENSGTFSTTVTIPDGLNFWDLGTYTLSVIATDRETGLQSSEVETSFSVLWSHQAPSLIPPVTYSLTSDTTVDADKTYYTYDSTTQTYSVVEPVGTENPASQGWYLEDDNDYIKLTPIDTVDDSGYHRQAVQITLTPPPACYFVSSDTEVDEDKTYYSYDSSTKTYTAVTPVGTENPSTQGWYEQYDDVYDIYRLTGDGAYLIGQGFPLTYTAVDEYAPFGDAMTHHYRIAIRTVDGDVEFADFEYVADGDAMRFDWAGGTLELPYNISIGDTYKKDVEIRKHMDGDMDAYWNSNIKRTASLNSDLIRLEQQTDVALARQLARYPGAVFVRTPDGSAYEADVQVTNMSTEGVIEAIAVDATEIGMTQEFVLPTPYTLVEAEEEQEG